MGKQKPKVLICIDWFLPGTASGGPVRSYANLIDHLCQDFEFYILTRATDYGSSDPYEGITPNTWVQHKPHTYIYYISSERLNNAHIKHLLKETTFDVAMINGIYSWYFSIWPLQVLKQGDKPVMVSARGMLNPQAFSVKGYKKRLFLALAKMTGFYKGITFHATNATEANYIKAILGKTTLVKIAPNLPRKHDVGVLTFEKTKQNPVRFVSVARIAKEKGTLRLLKVLVKVNLPLVLDLYGPVYDKAYWEQCQAVINALPSDIKVSYKGVLKSENVPQVLQSYDYFVLLSEGENFGHAILEAFSAGCPVIISHRTPWKGLRAKNVGWDVNLDTEEEILQAFNEALNLADSAYGKWSKAALVYAKSVVENPEVIEQNKRLFLNDRNTTI
ncbi:glycosyltransferase family 4 protein [uncultured Winogradskyella sp.]|uniref:glycosyltransferase family 4 protein n=1 Tax=uncultured Winogradskyella sp. TaxID=395353 RepID=UPI003511A9ED